MEDYVYVKPQFITINELERIDKLTFGRTIALKVFCKLLELVFPKISRNDLFEMKVRRFYMPILQRRLILKTFNSQFLVAASGNKVY